MHEYILYALLIFIPVGILMEFFLRREGLMLKFRVILEFFSLAIIITFPVLISRLGMWYAFCLYLAAIIALSWYFLHVSEGPSWYLRPAGSSHDDEVYAAERLIENNVVRTLGEVEDVMMQHNTIELVQPDNTKTVAEEAAVTTAEHNLQQEAEYQQSTAKPVESMNDASDQAEQPTASIDQSESGGVEMKRDIEETAVPAIVDESSFDEEDIPAYSESEETDKKPEAELNSDPLHAAENTFSDADLTEPVPADILEEKITILQEADAVESISLENAQDFNSYKDEMVEPVSAENDQMQPTAIQAALADEPALRKTEAAAAAEDESLPAANHANFLLNQLASEKHLDALIENGFELKQAHQYKDAVQFFQAAAEVAADEELKYLLIMEVVELHKENGMYAQAEQVLFLSSIGKAYKRTDIIDKINRQLSYIRLLSLELARLSLSNTPFADVPREVKMEIAGILEV